MLGCNFFPIFCQVKLCVWSVSPRCISMRVIRWSCGQSVFLVSWSFWQKLPEPSCLKGTDDYSWLRTARTNTQRKCITGARQGCHEFLGQQDEAYCKSCRLRLRLHDVVRRGLLETDCRNSVDTKCQTLKPLPQLMFSTIWCHSSATR